MDALVLTADEIRLVDAVQSGNDANFSDRIIDGRRTAVIRGEAIRRLMLALPVSRPGQAQPEVIAVAGPGVRLAHALVEGDIHLDYGCLSDGEEMPRLSMESCFIPGKIALRAARLRRLCLLGSEISLVLAQQAHISGQIDLRDVRSSGAMRGCAGKTLCRLSLRGAHIQDGIDARRTTLVSDVRREDFVKYAKRARYALDLAEARIGGDVRLFPDFCAYGGVNINGAVIEGSVQAHGAVITIEEMYAFDASNARIAGRLALDARQAEHGGDSVPFRCQGEMRLSNAQLAAGLKMTGAIVEGVIHADLIKITGDLSMNAHDGLISGQAAILPFSASGDIDLHGAQIGGNADFRGAVTGGALRLSTSRIGGHADFSPHIGVTSALHLRYTAMQSIELDECVIGGNLAMEGACLVGGMRARGLRVNGYGRMGHHPQFDSYCFESHASLEMDDASFGFDLDMSGASLHGELLAPNLRVGGKLCLCTPMPIRTVSQNGRRFFASGRVNLSGAVIRSDFDLSGATLQRGLRFRGGRVESSLVIEVDGGQRHNIGTESEPWIVMSSIDLLNSHANIVSDFLGDKLQYSDSFTLNLEGFTYGRFRGPEDIESLTKKESDRLNGRFSRERASERNWKQWLRLQYEPDARGRRRPTRDAYSPTPFNTLIRVMRRDGFTEEADAILVEKMRIERRFKPLPLRYALKPYGVFFHYGLEPLRGSLFYAGFIALVWAFIHVCDYGIAFDRMAPVYADMPPAVRTRLADLTVPPVLILRPQPETAHLRADRAQPYAGVTATHDAVPLTEPDSAATLASVPCGRRISPLLFSLDLIIPVVDFGQRNRCDFDETRGLGWMAAKALITLSGWIFTSLLVLTWSGVIRRRIEPSEA